MTVYTWDKTEDPGYPDVWFELFNGDATAKYLDVGVCDPMKENANVGYNIWADLSTGTNITVSYMLNGKEAAQTVPGASEDFFTGHFELVAVRVGSTLQLTVTLTNGTDVAVWTYTIANFTTETLSAQLNGNTYFIDDITVAVGAFVDAQA